MFCKQCKILMKHVISFEDDKIYSFFRCPRCYFNSKKHHFLIPLKPMQKKCEYKKSKKVKPYSSKTKKPNGG